MWQDMVDEAYNQFLGVVVDGRPLTKEELLKRFPVEPVNAGPPAEEGQPPKKSAEPYTRYRADGGIFTAAKAKELKLIDDLGDLDDAIKQAAKDANVGDDFRAVEYHRKFSIADLFGRFGAAPAPTRSVLDPASLKNALTPRVWYLAPGAELSGVFGAMGEDERIASPR
jgi:protease-4